MAVATANTRYSITTTAAHIQRPAGGGDWTIANLGPGIIFLHYTNYGGLATTAFTGTEAAIRALATAAEVGSGQYHIVPGAISHVMIVTGTGFTATALVSAGVQPCSANVLPVVASATGIVVTIAANSTIVTVAIPRGATRLYIELVNSHATVAWDQFDIYRRCHLSGSWEAVGTEDADFAAPLTSPLITFSISAAQEPLTLAATKIMHISMDVTATESVRFRASALVAASSAAYYYTVE